MNGLVHSTTVVLSSIGKKPSILSNLIFLMKEETKILKRPSFNF